MATVVGRLLYHVDADGTDMERQARRAAKNAAKGFDDLDKRAEKSTRNQQALDDRLTKNKLANLRKLEDRYSRLMRDQERDERRLDSTRRSFLTRRINLLAQVRRWAERIGIQDGENLRILERQTLENDRHLRGFQTRIANLEREVSIRRDLLDLTEKAVDREHLVVDVDVKDAELQRLRATLGTLDKYEQVTVDVEVDGMTLAIAQLTALERIAKRLDRMTISPNVNMAGVAASTAAAGAASGGGKGGFLGTLQKIGNMPLNVDSVKGLAIAIGLVLSALSQLAVLSSAVGAGIGILAGSLGAFALGLGAAIGGVVGIVSRMSEFNEAQEEYNKLVEKGSDLTEEESARLAELKGILDEMPEGYRTLKELGGAFKELGQNMGDSMIGIVAPALRDLKDNLLPGISDRLTGLSDLFATFASNVIGDMSSETGVARFRDILRDTTPVVKGLLDGVEELLGFLVNGFQISLPYARDFAEGFRDLMGAWKEWSASVEGENAIREWFERGQRVLGKLGGLFNQLLGTLHELTTPAAVRRTERFLDILVNMVNSLGPTLNTLGRLDLFGGLAQILESVFRALSPLMNALGPFLEMAMNALIPALRILGSVIQIATAPMMTLLQLFGEFAVYVQSQLLPYFEPLIVAFEYAGEVLSGLGTRIFEALLPHLDSLFGTIKGGIGEPEELARVIQENVIPWIDQMADTIVDFVVPALVEFIGYIKDVVSGFMSWLENNGGIPGVMEKVGTAMGALGTIASGMMDQINGVLTLLQFDFIGAADRFVQGANKIASGSNALSNIDWRAPSVGNSSHAAMYMASGGILSGPRRIIAGEAGPEAIVPLRRPLSQVDPAVRALSAIAQGFSPMASGGIVGGRTVNIEAGAIVIQGSGSAVRDAEVILNEIAERI